VEVVLAVGVLGVVLALTYAVGLPLANLLERHAVHPIAEAVGHLLSGSPGWVRGLLVDGAIRGGGAVLTLVPMLGVLFGAASIFEQTGCLARVTTATQKVTGRLGVSGALALPLCFGFACNVPAILSLRSVPTARDRLAATLLAPLVPCSARLAVVALLAPMFFPRSAPLVAVALVSTNLTLFALGGWCVMGRSRSPTRLLHEGGPPPLHRPDVRKALADLARGLGAFTRSAGPIVLGLSALTGLLGSVPGGGIERSLLAQTGKSLEPAARLAGLDDWRLIVALLSSAVTKETGVAVLGVVYGAGTDGAGLQEILTAAVPPASALAYLAVQMLFIPCVPTLWVMARETGSWKWSLASTAVMLVVSLAIGAVAFQTGRWLW
jgi:ferrous iron transport protein B